MNLQDLFTLENLNNAFYESARISYWKDSTQRYKSNLLQNNIKLRESIVSGKYTAHPTFDFIINERGKTRKIEAPILSDRIAQKIVCQQILIPQLSKYLIYDNYASLKNRGTSFARKRLDILLRRYIQKYGNDGYVLQIDIKNYFGSVDHTILKQMLHEKIHEPKEVMDLIDYMVDVSSRTDKGLNLGSEVPQICAVYYLSKVDNYIKSVKGIKYYGRYMDDMIIIGNSKEELKGLLKEIENQLSNLKLETNKKKTHITKLSHGFTYMQIKYHIDNGKIIKRPTHNKVARERRRLKKLKGLYDKGIMTELEIHNCYISWKNAILKDCNACIRTIKSIDSLYDKLFPIKEKYIRHSREYFIKKAFRENINLLIEIGYV